LIFIWLFISFSLFIRVWYQYHTLNQVIVGVVLGICFSLLMLLIASLYGIRADL
jgi:ABC-type transporter Mla maintaining outer membrane lipid asymmetry permease subunit MlaE